MTETLVTGVQTDERIVVTDQGQHLPYDALLIAIGSPKGRKKLVEIVKNQLVMETHVEREALLVLK